MKGAGRDCTSLFDKYHPWVNFDSLVGVSGKSLHWAGVGVVVLFEVLLLFVLPLWYTIMPRQNMFLYMICCGNIWLQAFDCDGNDFGGFRPYHPHSCS